MAKKSGAGNPPPDWLTGPTSPIEHWTEIRGYWRNRARMQPESADIAVCRQHFDFASEKLAQAAEENTTGARLIALEEVSAAIGRRLLSSEGERTAAPNRALGWLRDPSIMNRIDPELHAPILALFGGFAALVRAVLNADWNGAATISGDVARHVESMDAAFPELGSLASASKAIKRRQSKGVESGRASGRERRGDKSKLAKVLAAHDQGIGKQAAIAKEAGCTVPYVSKVLKKYRPRHVD